MSILETTKKSKVPFITLLGCTVFLILFGKIYNHYGHGVESFYMNYSFLYCLFGTLWYGGFLLLKKSPNAISRSILGAGLATCTVGSILKGIFQIAGTSSPYENWYFVVGGILCFLGLLALFIPKRK